MIACLKGRQRRDHFHAYEAPHANDVRCNAVLVTTPVCDPVKTVRVVKSPRAPEVSAMRKRPVSDLRRGDQPDRVDQWIRRASLESKLVELAAHVWLGRTFESAVWLSDPEIGF